MAKAGKAEIARARGTLTQERLRLKENQIALEREWERLRREREKMNAERAEVVAYLRRLCERWGDNDWADKLALAEILEVHLADHLTEGMDRVRRHMGRLEQALRAAETAPSPALRVVEVPRQPSARPALPELDDVSKVLPLRTQRGSSAYQAVCSCRWSGMVRDHEGVAEQDRGAHVRTHERRRQVVR